MAEKYSTEWWRWRINRKLADYIDEPSTAHHGELTALLEEYRQFCEMRQYAGMRDEHEWAMDWR